LATNNADLAVGLKNRQLDLRKFTNTNSSCCQGQIASSHVRESETPAQQMSIPSQEDRLTLNTLTESWKAHLNNV
jgi:hypothetical protein